jgi:hypothetical protein
MLAVRTNSVQEKRQSPLLSGENGKFLGAQSSGLRLRTRVFDGQIQAVDGNGDGAGGGRMPNAGSNRHGRFLSRNSEVQRAFNSTGS